MGGFSFSVVIPPLPPVVTLDPDNKGPDQVLSNGNLTVNGGVVGDWEQVYATFGRSSGKYYFEMFVGTTTVTYSGVGVGTGAESNETYCGDTADGWSDMAMGITNGRFYNSSYTSITGSGYNLNDVVMVAVDLDDNKIWFGKNDTWIGVGSPNPATGTDAAFTNLNTGTLYPSIYTYSQDNILTARFFASHFSYSPPSGFSAWDS